MTTNTDRQQNIPDAENIKRVKALGFLHNKGTDRFNCRVITRNGKITNQECRRIMEAAEKFGNGEIAMTTRLTMEIQGVAYDNIDAIREYLAAAGLQTGGTGAKVRPVVSCKGTTCQYGLYDTYQLSEKIHKQFYEGFSEVKLPHKFKIAVGGCPNNCVKPDLNDFGIVGQRMMQFDSEKCKGCKSCAIEKGCPVKAATVTGGKLSIDKTICNDCGRCVGKCPFHSTDESITGYKIYIGGRWGKKTAMGRPLSKIFTSEDEVLGTLEKAIRLFEKEGMPGERFADTISRLGFDTVEKNLL